jgi:hypothetical protein
VYFSWLMGVSVGLTKLLACVLSQGFLAFNCSAGFGTFLQVSLAGGLCKLLRQRRRKTTNTVPSTLSAVQAASQSPFINSKL